MDFSSVENDLLWKDLTLNVPKTGKKLLDNVNGKVGPSSLVALMGPSGAGKTTLLNALAGRLDNSLRLSGEILFNGKPRNISNWSQIMGYVEQEFYAYGNQTVLETLEFTSKMSGVYSSERIDEILSLLGLLKSKDTYIDKLSGGERKRVSIGVELLNNPPILFLDEPTSGLDSFNAMNILELLRKLSRMGKTILVTIHQPSYKMTTYFDELIIMSLGGVVFHGSCDKCIDFFAECGYPLPEKTNPTDFFLDTVSLDTSTDQMVDECMSKINSIKSNWKMRGVKYESTCTKEIMATDRSKFRNLIFVSLVWRSLSDFFRKTSYLYIKIAQKLIFILIFGLAYLRMGYSLNDINSRRGTFTFLVLNTMFGVCAPIFNLFSQEKRIIERERRSGMYSGWLAFLSKYVSELPFDLMYDLIYVACLYWIVGLNSDVGRFFICLVIIASLIVFAVAFGLTISVISPASNIAQIFGSTFILLFSVYSGTFGNTSTIPAWLRWLVWLSPVYYAYSAILQNQFSGVRFTTGSTSTPGDDFIKQNLDHTIGVWPNIFCLWGYAALWLVIGCISIEYITRNKINLEKNEDDRV